MILQLKWIVAVGLMCGFAARVGAESSMAALDQEYGFHGLTFGDDVERIKGLKKLAERGECETAYARRGDALRFDTVALSAIEYSFQNDRFTVVALLAKDTECVKLYEALHKKYGEDATKLGAAGTGKPFWTATWEGKRVRIDLNGPTGCTAIITAPEEAILEERRCREDDRVKAGSGH